MKRYALTTSLIVFAALIASSLRTESAIVDQAVYKLGEAGSLGINNIPQDSSGNSRHFASNSGTSAVVIDPAPVAGSTAALRITAPSGFYDTGAWTVPTNNFAYECWVRSDNVTQGKNFFHSHDSRVGTLKLHQGNANWGASYHSVGWIGPNGGVANSVVANEWMHMAVIRSSGVSRLYLNRVAVDGAIGNEPVVDSSQFHLGIHPGGTEGWGGDLDEMRIFTFDSATDDPVAALNGPRMTVIAEYPMGEAGTVDANNWPQDSTIYGHHLTAGVIPTLHTNDAAPNSTAYLRYPGTHGNYGPTPAPSIPASNYVMEAWVRVAAADVGQEDSTIVTLGNQNGCYQFVYRSAGWALARFKVAFVSQTDVLEADTWTHLAVVRDGGITRFLINSVEYATETTAPVNNGQLHVAVPPGGKESKFKGDIDNLRVFRFEGSFNVDDLLYQHAGTVLVVR